MEKERKTDICPECKKFCFTQEYLNKNEIESQTDFDCPVCGAVLHYSIVFIMQGNGHKDYTKILIFKTEE